MPRPVDRHFHRYSQLERAAAAWDVPPSRALDICEEIGVDLDGPSLSTEDLAELRRLHKETLVGAMGELRAAFTPLGDTFRTVWDDLPWWFKTVYVLGWIFILFFWPA
jgi:hypothetical protein